MASWLGKCTARGITIGMTAALLAVAGPAYGDERSASDCPGDVNGDNVVDLADLGLMLACYGLCVGDIDFRPAADLDENGCVGLPDLAALLAVYGRDCTLQGGDCTEPVPVTIDGADLPYWDINTTCGRGNDYHDTCLGAYDEGEDIIYELTIPHTMDVAIILDPLGTPYSAVAVSDTCPPGDSCLAYSYNAGAEPHGIDHVTLDSGVYYVMVDTWPPPDCIPEFLLVIEDSMHGWIECPPGGIPEDEPCGDSTNGGCYMAIPRFEPIACGETVCGTIWAESGVRDADWYEIIVDEPTRFTLDVEAEFPALIGLVETDPPGSGDCADMTGSLVPYDTGPSGELLNITTDFLPPGTYWFYISHADYHCSPCGEWNDYVATLACETASDPGDDCEDPIRVTLASWEDLPYEDTNSTCGRGNDYEGTCLGPFDAGEDIIYEITVLEPMVVDIYLNPHGTAWTGIAVSDTCPPGDTCLAYRCGSSADSRVIRSLSLEAGTYYILIDGWPPPDCIPEFTLVIGIPVPGWIECPPEGYMEDEECGDNTNGGCGLDPPHFEPLACGQTVCGTVWAEDGLRDNDWWEVTVTEPTVLTWTVEAEFPALIALVETDPPGSGNCADMTGYLDPWDTGYPYGYTSITTDVLPPGTYWLYVAHSDFYCHPCGGENDYVARLRCETPADPGDNCDAPLPLTLSLDDLPYAEINTTCGRGNDYEGTCLGDFDTSEDLIYELTILEPMEVDIVVNPHDAYCPGVALSDACPPGAACLDYVCGYSGTQVIPSVMLDAGVYYLMIDSQAPECIAELTLIIRAAMPCDTDCPPGAELEGEHCGDDTNGGCGLIPPAFEPIACGQTVCGTIWADDYLRDTDWYEVTVDEATRFTWHVMAEFPALVGLVETDPPGSGDCWDMTGHLNPWNIGSTCTSTSITTDLLPPGTYWFHVSHSDFFCDPCGQRNDYVATLTCETLSGPGDNCDDPAVVTLSNDDLPLVLLGTTCGRGNDYDNTCLGSWDGGEDIVYELHVMEEMWLAVALNAIETDWTGMAIDDTCPPDSACLAYSTAGDGEYWNDIDMLHLVPGTYYLMIDTWPSPDCIPVFELYFNYPPPP
jgi:hypothetical protein